MKIEKATNPFKEMEKAAEGISQLSLYMPTKPPSKLKAQWEACKTNNPWLLPKLAEVARELKRSGHERYSISGLFHILRWETRETTGDHGLKVNNNHQPFAARELMEQYPDLEGFFQLREQKPKIDGSWGQIH